MPILKNSPLVNAPAPKVYFSDLKQEYQRKCVDQKNINMTEELHQNLKDLAVAIKNCKANDNGTLEEINISQEQQALIDQEIENKKLMK